MKRQYLVYLFPPWTPGNYSEEHDACFSGLDQAYRRCREALEIEPDTRCVILREPDRVVFDDLAIRKALLLL